MASKLDITVRVISLLTDRKKERVKRHELDNSLFLDTERGTIQGNELTRTFPDLPRKHCQRTVRLDPDNTTLDRPRHRRAPTRSPRRDQRPTRHGRKTRPRRLQNMVEDDAR